MSRDRLYTGIGGSHFCEFLPDRDVLPRFPLVQTVTSGPLQIALPQLVEGLRIEWLSRGGVHREPRHGVPLLTGGGASGGSIEAQAPGHSSRAPDGCGGPVRVLRPGRFPRCFRPGYEGRGGIPPPHQPWRVQEEPPLPGHSPRVPRDVVLLHVSRCVRSCTPRRDLLPSGAVLCTKMFSNEVCGA